MKLLHGPNVDGVLALVDSHALALRERVVPLSKAALYAEKEAEAEAYLATQFAGLDRKVGPLLQAEVDATRTGLDAAVRDILTRAGVAKKAVAGIEREARRAKIEIRAAPDAAEAVKVLNLYKERNP